MRTKESVAVLRMTLAASGFIKTELFHKPLGCVVKALLEGEWLVSLLSHDAALMDILQSEIERCEEVLRGRKNRSKNQAGSLFVQAIDLVKGIFSEPFFNFTEGYWASTFTDYVNCVRFIYIMHGTTETLNFVKNVGFAKWCSMPISQCEKFLDGLVLSAEKTLRKSGLKYRDFASFLAGDLGVDGSFTSTITKKG